LTTTEAQGPVAIATASAALKGLVGSQAVRPATEGHGAPVQQSNGRNSNL
jgi:hypothetical protein